MAANIQKNLEKALNEFHFIRKAKLFTQKELSDVIRCRKRNEYALQKRIKRMRDYDSFIASEISLLKLIRIRRQKLAEFRFKDEIEKSIISRLMYLHRQLCFRFASRIDVWLRFIWFCERLGRRISADRVWQSALKVHARTEAGALWIAAAASKMGAVFSTSKQNSNSDTIEQTVIDDDQSMDDDSDLNENSESDDSAFEDEENEEEHEVGTKVEDALFSATDEDHSMLSVTDQYVKESVESDPDSVDKSDGEGRKLRQTTHSSARGPVGMVNQIIKSSRKNFSVLQTTRKVLGTRGATKLVQAKFSNSLMKAQIKVRREAKLAWDRAWLSSIREARQLLAQGIEFNCVQLSDQQVVKNPATALLVLQLARLELCAADFFINRVLPRHRIVNSNADKFENDSENYHQKVDSNKQFSSDELAVLGGTIEAETDQEKVVKSNEETDNNRDLKYEGGGIDKETRLRYAYIDSKILLNDVTEDIEMIAGGHLFKAVLEQLITDYPNDNEVVNNGLKQIMQAKTNSGRPLAASLIGKNLTEKVNKRIDSIMAKKYEQISSEANKPSQLENEMQTRLISSHEAYIREGRAGILKLWSLWGWYKPENQPKAEDSKFEISESKKIPLQCLDPVSSPSLYALLRARLQADGIEVNKYRLEQFEQQNKAKFLKSTQKKAKADSPEGKDSSDEYEDNDDEMLNEYYVQRNRAKIIINDARHILDCLAASTRWSTYSADFWLLYLWFESYVSRDMSRLPSIRWRARTALELANNKTELQRLVRLTTSETSEALASLADGFSPIEVYGATQFSAGAI